MGRNQIQLQKGMSFAPFHRLYGTLRAMSRSTCEDALAEFVAKCLMNADGEHRYTQISCLKNAEAE